MIFMSAICLLIQSFLQPAGTDEKKLEAALFELPNVAFTRISGAGEPHLRYMLRIKQLLDHRDESKGYFFQRVVLTHHGFDRPAVMNTQGYELNFEKNELESALDANYLNIEHRFFEESAPDSLQRNYLTLEQVTADLHYIRQLFKTIYKSKWISTGISKGGQTTIAYKYFYPNDVDVSVPYVAPFNYSIEDKRIYAFLDTVGPVECRKKIFKLQEYLLQNEDKALEKITWYAKGAGETFRYLDNSIGKAYEMAVLEFSFAFWQSGADCGEIPVNQSLDSCLNYLLRISGIKLFGDSSLKKYAPHYYQAATQMGYYGYNIEPFKKYIKHFSANPLASFPPKEAGVVTYSNTYNEKAAKWLREKGNNMIYIYGATDTWSAERVIPSALVNSRSFILPGKGHEKARIRNMDSSMQNDVKLLLEQWLGIVVDFSTLK